MQLNRSLCFVKACATSCTNYSAFICLWGGGACFKQTKHEPLQNPINLLACHRHKTFTICTKIVLSACVLHFIVQKIHEDSNLFTNLTIPTSNVQQKLHIVSYSMCPPPHNATTLKRSHFWQWSKLVCCIEISIQLNMQCAHFNAYIVLYNDCMVIGLWWSSHIWVIYSYNVLCINWISISHPRYVVILLYSLYFMYYRMTL